ncbi:MAG: hypothetical protein AAF352_01115, partial [Pseudomonadota bacterium]
MAQNFWDMLDAEIALWREADRQIPVWWRDDDATWNCDKLQRLLRVSDGLPICLAVIPKMLDISLQHFVDDYKNITIAQHGLTHENLAPAGVRKSEFGYVKENMARFHEGQEILRIMFGNRVSPIFVPPWNRIAHATRRDLEAQGIVVSCYSGTKDSILTQQMMQF